MEISNLFSSLPGMYVTQSFSHALTSAIISGMAVQAWRIKDPVVKQRFHLITVLFPIFSFPLYQIMNPSRSSIFFRLDALFDSSGWLNLELWGKIPLSLFFLFIVFLTTAIFLVQEMIPVLRHVFEPRDVGGGRTDRVDTGLREEMRDLLAGRREEPDIVLIRDDDHILYSSTGKRPVIFLSTGLVDELSREEIRAVIAHEIAHIERNRMPLLIAVFTLRIAMFFNPIVLLEFRRAVQEEEKICDDSAVSLSGNPRALAGALRKLYYEPGTVHPLNVTRLSELRASFEEYSHNEQIESRIRRLEEGEVRQGGGEGFAFFFTLVVITALNYFVV